MSGRRLLAALDTKDIEKIKFELALYAETEQRVAMQIKAREALATLLGSSNTASCNQALETLRTLVSTSQDPVPPSSPVASVSSGGDSSVLVVKSRLHQIGDVPCRELFAQIVSDAHCRTEALRQVVEPLGLDIDPGSHTVYDSNGWCYTVPKMSGCWYTLSDL
jgi:hypothetical protein